MNLLILIVDIVLCIDSILFGSLVLILVPLDKIYSSNIEIPGIVMSIKLSVDSTIFKKYSNFELS